jgi:hypothetical protein
VANLQLAPDAQIRVRVTLTQGLMTSPLGAPLDVICIGANNKMDHAVRVTMWGLEANDGSGDQLVMIQPMMGSELPGMVPAHDSATGYHDWPPLLGNPKLDLRRPVQAFVQLATGERFRSRPQQLFVPNALRRVA